MLRQISVAAAAAVVVIAEMISFAVPAKATVYDFTYVGGTNDPSVSGSGTFTTNATDNLVISGSGIFSMSPLSGQGTTLFPVTAFTAGLSSDNVFPIDSSAGILFQGTSDTNFYVNIFAPTGLTLGAGISDAWLSAVDGGPGFLFGSLPFVGLCVHCIADGTLSITAATPLPSTWGMMLFGLGVLGFMGYRRKNRVALNAA